MMRATYTTIIGMMTIAATLSGCLEDAAGQQNNKKQQAALAREAASNVVFNGNAEIDNIKHKLELTSDPALVGYVLLMNYAGQPIYYGATKGKPTSGGKRLTPTYEYKHIDCGQYTCDNQVLAPSDEGTYGSSGDYIFFTTVGGQLMQWNGQYLWSDKPFRTNAAPLVVEMTTQAAK